MVRTVEQQTSTGFWSRAADKLAVVLPIPQPQIRLESKQQESNDGFFLDERGLKTELRYATNDYKILNPGSLPYLSRGGVNLINIVTAKQADTLLFLDKSGRPAAYFFLKLWHDLHPLRQLPRIRFLNVGRELYPQDVDSEEVIQEIAARYRELSETRLIIVDEYVDRGNSLRLAKQLIQNACPQTNIVLCLGMFEHWVPWYGRIYQIGVKDQVLGAHFLAKPYKGDPQSVWDDNRPQYVRQSVRGLRSELSRLSRTITRHVERKPVTQLWLRNFLPKQLNRELN